MRIISEASVLPPRVRPAARRRSGSFHEKLQFLRGVMASPAGVSALFPSSRPLADALAAPIPSHEGRVLELGPGTGAVTQAIVARGIPATRIVAVEYDRQFVDLLGARFPGLSVLQGDALNLRGVLGSPRESYSAVVSGLPLINFSMRTRRAVIEDGLSRVRPGAPFIQVSYHGRPAVPPSHDLAVERAAFVWRNIPPAYVWVYRRLIKN